MFEAIGGQRPQRAVWREEIPDADAVTNRARFIREIRGEETEQDRCAAHLQEILHAHDAEDDTPQ